ncbi:MAG: hypothetical protein ACKVQU_29985 [Burkholderiales bacterium]
MNRLPLWIISFSAAWILFLVMGLRQDFGLLVPPLAADLDIDRGPFGFGIAASNLLWDIGLSATGFAVLLATAVLCFVGAVLHWSIVKRPVLAPERAMAS